MKLFKKPDPKAEFLKTLDLPKPDRTLWKTKSGENILVSKMDDNHLKNAHRMMARKLRAWGVLQQEIDRRGLEPLAVEPLNKVVVQRLYGSLEKQGGDFDPYEEDLLRYCSEQDLF